MFCCSNFELYHGSIHLLVRFLTFHNSSLGVTHLGAQFLPVHIVLSDPVPDSRFVFCNYKEIIEYSTGKMMKEFTIPAVPAITTDNTTFMCNFTANNRSRRIPFTVSFNNSVPLYLTGIFLNAGFFGMFLFSDQF